MKVGDLVRIKDTIVLDVIVYNEWNGQMGIITKVPRTRSGMWAIRLTSGELIATGLKNRIEVINENR